MNSTPVAALRRLGLALAAGGIVAGGAWAASEAPADASGSEPAAAAPMPPATDEADLSAGHGPGPDHGAYGEHEHGMPGWHHGAGMWRHGGMGGPDPGMMMEHGFFAALRQLDLTPVQHEQMRTIVFNAREAVRMERAKEQQSGAAERRRDDFAVLANPGDPNYARALEQLKTHAAERVQQAIARASETEQKLYNVLTAEQKARLPQVLSEQRARHEEGMGEMHRHHEGEGPMQAPAAPPAAH
jgi:Spy/CpxP family protein refolding chaperone